MKLLLSPDDFIRKVGTPPGFHVCFFRNGDDLFVFIIDLTKRSLRHSTFSKLCEVFTVSTCLGEEKEGVFDIIIDYILINEIEGFVQVQEIDFPSIVEKRMFIIE